MVVIVEGIEMTDMKVNEEKRLQKEMTDVWLPYVKKNGTVGIRKKYMSLSYCEILSVHAQAKNDKLPTVGWDQVTQ